MLFYNQHKKTASIGCQFLETTNSIWSAGRDWRGILQNNQHSLIAQNVLSNFKLGITKLSASWQVKCQYHKQVWIHGKSQNDISNMRMSRESCYQNSKNKKFTCNIHVKSYFTCEFLNFWVFITFCIHMGNVRLKMCRHVNSLVVLGPQIHLNINFCFYLKKYIYLGKKITRSDIFIQI